MKTKLAVVIILAINSAAQVRAEDINLGTETDGTSYVIDTGTIGKHTYPMGAGGNLVGVLTPKEYRETWAKRINQKGEVVAQVLWVFDCSSRAGELAEANSLDTSKSRDVTANAQSTGVERYMVRIPPKSWFDVAEKVVCKKR